MRGFSDEWYLVYQHWIDMVKTTGEDYGRILLGTSAVYLIGKKYLIATNHFKISMEFT